MKQLLQNLRSGEAVVAEVPAPTPQPGEALVRQRPRWFPPAPSAWWSSLPGKSLVGKARSRPDLVRQVLDKARREGLLTTLEAAINRLDQPMALGYSSAGTVMALGEGSRSSHRAAGGLRRGRLCGSRRVRGRAEQPARAPAGRVDFEPAAFSHPGGDCPAWFPPGPGAAW